MFILCEDPSSEFKVIICCVVVRGQIMFKLNTALFICRCFVKWEQQTGLMRGRLSGGIFKIVLLNRGSLVPIRVCIAPTAR